MAKAACAWLLLVQFLAMCSVLIPGSISVSDSALIVLHCLYDLRHRLLDALDLHNSAGCTWSAEGRWSAIFVNFM